MMKITDPVAYLKEHYNYEINMLRCTHALLAKELDKFSQNVLIESFCVHARALWDFYSPSQNSKPDDVCAADFIASSQFGPTATSKICNDIRVRINKQIAHLTTGRESPIKKVDDIDRSELAVAIEIDHAAFKLAVEQRYANCFVDER